MHYSCDQLYTFARNLMTGKYGRMPTLVMGDPGVGKT